MKALAEKVVRCCGEIARMSEEPGRTTRTFLSPPMRDAHALLSGWMREIGMRVWVDAAGNLRGLYGESGKPRLLMGSHLDTVPNAGAFDGILGVVLAIALAETRPESALEIVGFSEEEGVRFGVPFIGSRALTGELTGETLDRRDGRGVSVREAIRGFGLDAEEIGSARLAPDVIGYLEFHIEQGPVMEDLGLPLGLVEAIAGQSRWMLTFEGRANHAGTTPMRMRRDALAAAAEWIGEVERQAGGVDGLVATVGAMDVSPNAGNVIPGRVRASLDVRHRNDSTRSGAVDAVLAAAGKICARRGMEFSAEERLNQPAVAMDESLTERLGRAVEGAGFVAHRMTSGAGHDAMVVAPHVPAAMLFLRSPGGVSHHPDESVLTEDVAAALAVGARFLKYA